MSWWSKFKRGVVWVWASPLGAILRQALMAALALAESYLLKQVLGASTVRARELEAEIGAGKGSQKAVALDTFIVDMLVRVGVEAVPRLVHWIREQAVMAIHAEGT